MMTVTLSWWSVSFILMMGTALYDDDDSCLMIGTFYFGDDGSRWRRLFLDNRRLFLDDRRFLFRWRRILNDRWLYVMTTGIEWSVALCDDDGFQWRRISDNGVVNNCLIGLIIWWFNCLIGLMTRRIDGLMACFAWLGGVTILDDWRLFMVTATLYNDQRLCIATTLDGDGDYLWWQLCGDGVSLWWRRIFMIIGAIWWRRFLVASIRWRLILCGDYLVAADYWRRLVDPLYSVGNGVYLLISWNLGYVTRYVLFESSIARVFLMSGVRGSSYW